MIKKCSKCKLEKNIDQFHKNKNKKDGLHDYCKECNSIRKKNSYDYDKSKTSYLKHKYNLTAEKLENLFLNQGKKCKICKTEYSTVSKHKGLYIDHCHITGNVRGLLCNNCNIVLGNSNDDVSILLAAIDYLIDYKKSYLNIK